MRPDRHRLRHPGVSADLLPAAARASLGPLRYKPIDPLYLTTFSDPPGATTGGACFGDSGGPVLLAKRNAKERTILAMVGHYEDPFAFPCTNADIHYRTDTESHLRFINGIIHSVRTGKD